MAYLSYGISELQSFIILYIYICQPGRIYALREISTEICTSKSLTIANGFSVQAAKGYSFKPIFQDYLNHYILDKAGSAIIGCCQFFMYGNKHMIHLD